MLAFVGLGNLGPKSTIDKKEMKKKVISQWEEKANDAEKKTE